MNPYYLDTETVGLHGVIVLMQTAVGDGPIELWEPWRNPIKETMERIEAIANHPDGVVLFNATFDWFHICKFYTILSLMSDPEAILLDCLDEFVAKETAGRDGPCVKPVKVIDLMLHARKGPYQSTMNRGDIRIRRVPTPLAPLLALELDRRVPLSPILFARQKVKKRWQAFPITDAKGDVDPFFSDVVLKFAPSSALKALAVDALGIAPEAILKFGDIEPDAPQPEEFGFAPYASGPNAWPSVLQKHIDHWATHDQAREYARLDIVYTRDLYKHFGCPEMGDDDSVLACMVGAVRWRGLRVDLEKLRKVRDNAVERVSEVPTAPSRVKPWIFELLSPEEQLATGGSTRKTILEGLMKQVNVRHESCEGQGCDDCGGTGKYTHPAAERARAVLEARKAKYEINFYDKILAAGRLHPAFDVIGALSSRMSGRGGDLNVQGVKRDKYVRECFPLAWDGYQLCGGDFEGFEVVLAEAAYNDPDLRKDLLTQRPCPKCSGDKPTCGECGGTGMTSTKIHALFGVNVYPDRTYEEILKDKEVYTRCKSAVFAMLYGGEGFTLQSRLGVDLSVADAAFRRFCQKYPGVGRAQKRLSERFCTMTQNEDTFRITWEDPADFAESLFGFRRYFTLENQIAKALFDLAQSPPKVWTSLKLKVRRRAEREQSASGATQSALYGAAFAVQGSNKRAAGNHEIQSSGATITKAVQRRVWDFQPSGVHEFVVIPINVHDEIMSPTRPDLVERVKDAVDRKVDDFRPRVPLIKMEWDTKLRSWADK